MRELQREREDIVSTWEREWERRETRMRRIFISDGSIDSNYLSVFLLFPLFVCPSVCFPCLSLCVSGEACVSLFVCLFLCLFLCVSDWESLCLNLLCRAGVLYSYLSPLLLELLEHNNFNNIFNCFLIFHMQESCGCDNAHVISFEFNCNNNSGCY